MSNQDERPEITAGARTKRLPNVSKMKAEILKIPLLEANKMSYLVV